MHGPSIKYKRNEIFLDVEERLSMTIAADGAVVTSEANGRINVRPWLSGMPEV
jgi:AP-2 complex subunit mu-1